MNNWMSDPFPYPDKPIDRGKVLTAEDLEQLGGFARYKDVDGDGVGYRTLPGTNHPAAAYFTRGSGHNEKAAVHRARRRLRQQHGPPGAQVRSDAQARSCRRWSTTTRSAKIGFVALGTSHYAVEKAAISCKRVRYRDQLPAAARVSVHPGAAGLHPPPRSRVRGRPEPRRAVAGADAPGIRAGRHRQAAQHALLRRPAARCAHRHRRNRPPGGQL